MPPLSQRECHRVEHCAGAELIGPPRFLFGGELPSGAQTTARPQGSLLFAQSCAESLSQKRAYQLIVMLALLPNVRSPTHGVGKSTFGISPNGEIASRIRPTAFVRHALRATLGHTRGFGARAEGSSPARSAAPIRGCVGPGNISGNAFMSAASLPSCEDRTEKRGPSGTNGPRGRMHQLPRETRRHGRLARQRGRS
jgi:hypothetical protein